MPRQLKFFEAILEATDICLKNDPNVYVMGLGVPDPKGIFGTTRGLAEKYGRERILDIPTSESAMTGVAIGSALIGMRPILTHQRLDFALYSIDQIVNHAAKWHYMFGGQAKLPLVIRMVVGRGWGQGAQHSQSLQAWFAHVPGLKVVMPTTAYDAKGLLIASIKDNNPVIFIEHRWLHNISGYVPEGEYEVELGKGSVIREGKDVTIVSVSYMTLEAIKAAAALAKDGISAEIIDVRTLKPLDEGLIIESVQKTGRCLVVDTGWKSLGFSAEVLALVCEKAFNDLKSAPSRIALPDCPTPATISLSNHFYPRAVHMIEEIHKMMGFDATKPLLEVSASTPLDVPDSTFKGPF